MRLWVLQSFVKDFFKGKTASGKTGRLTELKAVIFKQCRRRPDLLFDLNRLKLAILSKHAQAGRLRVALTELAVLRLTKDKDLARRFFDYPPRVIAEQLTVLEYAIFSKVEPEEFFVKTDRKLPLQLLLARADQMSYWVASMILAQEKLESNLRAIRQFIQIAELDNYNGMQGILGGLHLWAVSRLLKSVFRPQLDGGLKMILGRLEYIMSPANNYANYRKILAKKKEALSAGLPTLPYIGLFMKDFALIDEGNPDVFADGRVNTEKLALVGSTLRNVQAFQVVDFHKRVKGKVTPLLKYLSALPRKSEQELEQASEVLRPRKGVVEEDPAESSSTLSLGSMEASLSSVSTPGGSDDGSSSRDNSDGGEMVELSATDSTAELAIEAYL